MSRDSKAKYQCSGCCRAFHGLTPCKPPSRKLISERADLLDARAKAREALKKTEDALAKFDAEEPFVVRYFEARAKRKIDAGEPLGDLEIQSEEVARYATAVGAVATNVTHDDDSEKMILDEQDAREEGL